jgi:hypothetical protein
MAKWISGATCAAAVLSMTLAAAQTAPPQTTSQSSQSNTGRAPDKPSTTGEAAKGTKEATIAGCLVRDAANGGQASITSNGISYKLTGKDDKELEQYLGKRVEVTGLLESGSSAARATSGKTSAGGTSVPPKEQTATGGQSDVTATGTPRDNTVPPDATAPRDAVPLATDKGTTADLTGRVQVKTLKIVSPNCL